MSRKRFNPLEDPPNASSSDEDEELETNSLAGNSSSGEETDDEEPSSKKPEPAPEKQHRASEPGSGSDEETDSDSQSERNVSGKKKSITGTKKAKPLSKSSAKKRALSETDVAAAASTEEAKKKKVKSGEDGKKTYFQRVWSEEDEIAALQGLIDYKNDTGVNPYDDTNAFYLSVKKSISFDVSKTQLLKKLWGLKTKYENNLGKERNGEEVAFGKPHDRKVYDLSKSFWGGADGVVMVALDSAVKSNGKSKKKSSGKKVESVKKKQELASSSSSPNGKSCEEEVMVTNKEDVAEVEAFEKSGLVKVLTRFGVDDISAQQGWSRLALEDKKRFEEEWKVLQLKELEFYSEKSGFINEVVTKMAEAFQPNP